jgi:hypothetical protein
MIEMSIVEQICFGLTGVFALGIAIALIQHGFEMRRGAREYAEWCKAREATKGKRP